MFCQCPSRRWWFRCRSVLVVSVTICVGGLVSFCHFCICLASQSGKFNDFEISDLVVVLRVYDPLVVFACFMPVGGFLVPSLLFGPW